MSISATQNYSALSGKNQAAFGGKYYPDTPSNRAYCAQWEDEHCPEGGWSTSRDWAAIKPHPRPRGSGYEDSLISSHGSHGSHSQGFLDGIGHALSDAGHAISRAFTHFWHLPTQDMIIVGVGFMIAGGLIWELGLKKLFNKN